MREIEKIICSCSGNPIERDTTKKERDKYGCFRDSQEFSCCVAAYVCPKCKIRWLYVYKAPEME